MKRDHKRRKPTEETYERGGEYEEMEKVPRMEQEEKEYEAGDDGGKEVYGGRD